MAVTPTPSPTPQSIYSAHKTFAEDLKLTAELFALGAALLAGGSAIWKFFDLEQYHGWHWLPMAAAGYLSVIGAVVLGTVLVFTAFIRVEWMVFGVQVPSTPSSWVGRIKSFRFWFGVVAAVLVALAMLHTMSVIFRTT